MADEKATTMYTANVYDYNRYGTLYAAFDPLELRAQIVQDEVEKAISSQRIPDDAAASVEDLLSALSDEPSIDDLQRVIEKYTYHSPEIVVVFSQVEIKPRSELKYIS